LVGTRIGPVTPGQTDDMPRVTVGKLSPL